MTALIVKDLRLAYDALVRWAVVVITIIVASLCVPALVPRFFGPGDATTTIALLGFLLALTCGATAAWVTIAVLLGDRLHQGATLAAVLPIDRTRQVVAKSVAIAIGCAIPTLVSILCTVGWTGFDAWWILSHTLAGVGFALGVGPFVRRTFEGVAMAFVLGFGCAVAAGVGAIACNALGSIGTPISEATAAAVVAQVVPSAVKCAGVLAGLFGLLSLEHPMIRRHWRAALATLFVVTILAAAELTFLGHRVMAGPVTLNSTGAPFNGVFR